MSGEKSMLCRWDAELENGTRVPVTARDIQDASVQLKARGINTGANPIKKLHFL